MYEPFKYATTTGKPNDRRKSARYYVAGAAWCEWLTADGRRHEGWGVTRNMGMVGAFIESDSLPPVGAVLTLVVTLRTKWQTCITVCLRGAGDVRHVQQGPCQASGYGASVAFHTAAPESLRFTKVPQ